MQTSDIDLSNPILDSPPLNSPVFTDLDHLAGAALSRITFGFSPAAIWLAALDWSLHWADSPGKRLQSALEICDDTLHFLTFAAHNLLNEEQADLVSAAADDHRFQSDAWQQWPFRWFAQGFLLQEKWWASATRNVLGVSPHHENMVAFAARQWLDVFSPSNFPLTNPDVLNKTLEDNGLNLLRGLGHLLGDVARNATGKLPAGSEQFEVGKNVAATPGKVILRNHLMELIQYAPTTTIVYAEPILIVPAWIGKYYILDLSPENSLIRYLVAQGHTVFCMSWCNVTQLDRDVDLNEYRQHGVMDSLDAINKILPERRVHAVGYCLGGTLLSIAAAAMARSEPERLASMTLFAAQTDFSEPGELQLFIDHSQIGILESMMWARGVLGSEQMAGAFQILQSNDLVWSRLIHDYLMGERRAVTDLMAWNADGTRMPYRMHSEYLRSLFLNNDLAAGRLQVDGRTIAIQNIRLPIFVVGTESDRVAPWRSVFKIHQLADTDITFALTNGGHNAGIVNEPGHPRRHFRLHTKFANDIDLSPDEWITAAELHEGSWWTAWTNWLQKNSSSPVTPPAMGIEGNKILGDAPGTYVLQH